MRLNRTFSDGGCGDVRVSAFCPEKTPLATGTVKLRRRTWCWRIYEPGASLSKRA